MSEFLRTMTLYKGRPDETPAGFIGCGDGYVDTDGCAVVVLYVSAAGTKQNEGQDLQLRVGDAFDLGDEQWEVSRIVDPEHPMVTLTRIK